MKLSLITLNNSILPEKMNAVVLEKPFYLNYKEIPVWPIESYHDIDMVLVKVKACGICGSDFRYYQGENPWAQHTMGLHLENPPNIVLGHEYVGEVVAVLSEKNKKWLGKHVVPICSKVCGKCNFCRTNRAHLCENTIHMGHGQGWGDLSYYPGAYAEYVPAWGNNCYEIPSHVTFEEAAMMDVLAVCVHAFNQAGHQINMPILINGCGPIGNGIGQVARNYGVEEDNIIIIENSDIAINVARSNKFKNIINSIEEDIQEIFDRILYITKNKRIFSIFDSIGTDMSLKLGLKVLDKGGTYVNLAVHDHELTSLNQMNLSSERKLTTSSNFSISDYEIALNWLNEGKFSFKEWFTKISLEEVPKVFKEIIENKRNRDYFKIIIQEI